MKKSLFLMALLCNTSVLSANCKIPMLSAGYTEDDFYILGNDTIVITKPEFVMRNSVSVPGCDIVGTMLDIYGKKMEDKVTIRAKRIKAWLLTANADLNVEELIIKETIC